jgi:hypothetical protein
MPKLLSNNRITDKNIFGRVIQHDQFFLNNGSPTFGNLQVDGNLLVEGNLTVEGNTFLKDTEFLEIWDNIILINAGAASPENTISLNQAGLEIERGYNIPNYRIVFDETLGTLVIGTLDNYQPVATRENTPIANGIMIWNSINNRIEARQTIDLDISFNYTTDSTSITSGSVTVKGGVGISKNLHVGKSIYLQGDNLNNSSRIWTDDLNNNTLTLQSNSDIKFDTPNVNVSYNTKLLFGEIADNIYIKGDDLDLLFNVNTNQNIKIPQGVNFVFGSNTQKIYEDIQNDLNIESAGDIKLTATGNGAVVVPVNKSINFATSSQKIQSDNLNNLIISSGNHILLYPGNNKYVNLPIGSGLQINNNEHYGVFGVENKLNINSPSGVKLSDGIPLYFGNNDIDYITKNNPGNGIILNANESVVVSFEKTITGTTSTNGTLYIRGNLDISGTIIVTSGAYSLQLQTLEVEDNLIITNSGRIEDIDGGILIQRGPGVTNNYEINKYAAMYYKESTDEITFAYTDMDPLSRNNVTINDYIPIRTKNIRITSTENANTTHSRGSIITPGGVIIGKSLNVGNSIETTSLTTTNVQSSNINATAITTSNINVTGTLEASNLTTASVILTGGLAVNKSIITGDKLNVKSIENTTSKTSGALIVEGGLSVFKDTLLSGKLKLTDTVSSINSSTGSVVLNGGISINCTSNAVSYTSGGAMTLAGGLAVHKNAYIGESLTSAELTVLDKTSLCANRTMISINNTSGNSVWYHLADITGNELISYDINMYENNVNHSLRFRIALDLTQEQTILPESTFTHSHTGLEFDSNEKSDFYVYRKEDNGGWLYKLYFLVYKNSNIHIDSRNIGTLNPVIDQELLSPEWEQVYNTRNKNNLSPLLEIYDLTVEGDQFKVVDNLPIIGYVSNRITSGSDNIGVLHQRFQVSNTNGSGYVVSDTPIFTGKLRAIVNNTILDLSSGNTISNYEGAWIKIETNGNLEIRQIVEYSPSQRRLIVDEEFSTLSVENSAVSIYGYGIVSPIFDENDKKYKIKLSSLAPNGKTPVHHTDCPLEFGNLTITDTANSINSSTGSLIVNGGISIKCSTDATSFTSGGGLTISGGASINKKLFVGDNLTIGKNISNFTTSGQLNINGENGEFTLNCETTGHNFINFSKKDSNIKYNILHIDDALKIEYTSTGEQPLERSTALSVKSNGFVGINVSNLSNINSPLTLPKNNFISSDSNDGFIGLIGSKSNINSNNARVLLYGNENIQYSGNVEINAGHSNGNVIFTTSNRDVMKINSNGNIDIYTTTPSTSINNGSLVVNGGVAIKSTHNASGYTSGGAITIAGGATIVKDLYVGGNLIIDGIAQIRSLLDNQFAITFNTTGSVSSLSYDNERLLKIDNEYILSFWVSAIPTNSSQLCQFEFILPDVTTNFTHRGDVIASCNGWTNQTSDLFPVFNVICVADPGTNKAIVKFQSVSTSEHFFSIICRYTAQEQVIPPPS